jgi:hypothetical protein
MSKIITEADLYKIKDAAFGRMRPDRVGAFLWGTLIYSAVTVIGAMFGIGQSVLDIEPMLLLAVRIATILLGVQFVLTVVFSFSAVGYAMQKLQAIIMTIIALKFSIDAYLFFFAAAILGSAPQYIVNTGFIIMAGGFVFLILSTIRGFNRVKKGELRQGGKGLYNFKGSKSFISLPALFGIALIAGSLSKAVSGMEGSIGMFFLLFLAMILQYVMAIALPEFFILLYAKSRFPSFIVPPRKVSGRKGKTV